MMEGDTMTNFPASGIRVLGFRRFQLIEPIGFTVKGVWYEVPKFFITDCATMPPILYGIFHQFGRHWRAAVIHDYLYTRVGKVSENVTISRKEVDILFYQKMFIDGCPKWRAKLFYFAVRALGGKYWKEYGERFNE